MGFELKPSFRRKFSIVRHFDTWKEQKEWIRGYNKRYPDQPLHDVDAAIKRNKSQYFYHTHEPISPLERNIYLLRNKNNLKYSVPESKITTEKYIDLSNYSHVSYAMVSDVLRSKDFLTYNKETQDTIWNLFHQTWEEEREERLAQIEDEVMHMHDNEHDYSNLDVYVDENGIPDYSRHRDGSVNYGYVPEEKLHVTQYMPPTEDEIFSEAFHTNIPSDVEQFINEDHTFNDNGYIKTHSIDYLKNVYDTAYTPKYASSITVYPYDYKTPSGDIIKTYDYGYQFNNSSRPEYRTAERLINDKNIFAGGLYPSVSDSNWHLGHNVIYRKRKQGPEHWATANRTFNTTRKYGYSNSLYTTLINKYGKKRADNILYNARSSNMSPDEIIQQAIHDASDLQRFYLDEKKAQLERQRRIAAGESGMSSGSSQGGWGKTPPHTLFDYIHNDKAKQQYIDNYTPSYPILSSLVQKGVTEGKGWSAPIVIFDTETTSLKPNRQTVNVAALKVRYNFKTSKWAILDTYEKYYYPDFNFGEFSKWNLEDAIDIYNQSESVRLHGLTTEQIRANRRGYDNLISKTFNTKEREAFVRWLTKDNEYPIIVGNNIKFDALAINDAFVKYTGNNPTYLDLMDMAQATPTLIRELEKDKLLHGKGGLSVQRLYSRLLNDTDYVEKHFGGQDVVDEFAILRELTDKIRNEHTSPDGWNKISSVMMEDSSMTGKWVTYPWNTVPVAMDYTAPVITEQSLKELGLTSEAAKKIYKKYKLGKYKPGSIGKAILHNLGLNKEALVMNVLTKDIHKMSKSQLKEFKSYFTDKRIKELTGDKSVVETMVFSGDTLVNNGFVNEDFVDYDNAGYEDYDLHVLTGEGDETFINWNNQSRDTELEELNKDEYTGSLGTYEISGKDIKRQKEKNKFYGRSVSSSLYTASEATYYNEETSVSDFSEKQFLESIVAEMNRYPSYRGKLYVVFNGEKYIIASDDPVVAKQLKTGTGTLDKLPDEYDGRSTYDRYSKVYDEEDILEEIQRRTHMKVESSWQKRYIQLGDALAFKQLTQPEYDYIIQKMGKKKYAKSDDERRRYLKLHPIKNILRNSAFAVARRNFQSFSVTEAANKVKFMASLNNDVDFLPPGVIDDLRSGIMNGTMSVDNARDVRNYFYENAAASVALDVNKEVATNQEVASYLANEEAAEEAKREAAWRSREADVKANKEYEESFLNRRSHEKYQKRAMREGLGDRVDYLVNHGRLSRGTADAIISKFDSEVANGTGSMEAFEKALNKATKEIDRSVVAQQKAYKAWENMSKAYDFNNVYSTAYSQINGTVGAAQGVLPNFMMNPLRRGAAAIINGYEIDRARYNYYARWAKTGRNIATVAGSLIGAAIPGMGPIGGVLGASIGAGVGEIGTDLYNNWLWRKEKRYTEIGQTMQNSLNTFGLLKSVSGLDVAFSALTKTVKWATLGLVGMVTKGLHSMQSLGNPITTLSGVDYRNYQVYGRMDRMFGFSNGTINSSIENFALQQKRMYTYGQMDIDRVVAASMLGVFGSVYANGGDPKTNYEATVNKIASSGITDTKISWAAMIDKTLPQILQIMKDMNAKSLQDVYKQSGVSFNELTDSERRQMRRVSFGYRTALSNISTSWQRMGAALWDGGLNRLFDRFGKWIEAIAQNAGVWIAKINPLITAFDKLFEAFKTGDSNAIQEAFKNLKEELGKIFDNLKEPIAKVVSGLSVALLAGVQTMIPTIANMMQALIGEIGKFNIDKNALAHNINYDTNFPIIRYGEQKGQFAYLGNNDNERKWFNKVVTNPDLTTEQKKMQLGRLMPNVFGLPKKWVNTEDYTPIEAISTAQDVIGNTAGQLQTDEMFEKFYNAMMKAFESFGIDINLKDVNSGDTKELKGTSTAIRTWTIDKQLAN